MKLWALPALLAAAIPSFAQSGRPAPAVEFTSIEALSAQANNLRDAVADPSSTEVSLKARAAGFFDRIPEVKPVVPVYVRYVDRAETTGKLGSLESMQAAADARIAWWKSNRTVKGVPAKLDLAVAYGRTMKDQKRIQFESKLAKKQMGMFRYNTARLDGGTIDINERMKMFCALIGEQFCYATTVHELTHALDREAGLLTPEKWREGEVSAFKNQHDWIKIVDETGERLVTKHSELVIMRNREKDPDMKELLSDAILYLEHLSDVVGTNGEEAALFRLVDRLYKGKSHGHEHDSPTKS